MQIEVNLFSGSPNPRWTVTSEEASEFLRRVQALPESGKEQSVSDRLGYSGLIVTDLAPQAGYRQIEVFEGLVTIIDEFDESDESDESNIPSTQFLDPGRGLEQWLFQTGNGRLNNHLYQQIKQGIHF
jgi:hypothetical protein